MAHTQFADQLASTDWVCAKFDFEQTFSLPNWQPVKRTRQSAAIYFTQYSLHIRFIFAKLA